jgi:hypothetical protein
MTRLRRHNTPCLPAESHCGPGGVKSAIGHPDVKAAIKDLQLQSPLRSPGRVRWPWNLRRFRAGSRRSPSPLLLFVQEGPR